MCQFQPQLLVHTIIVLLFSSFEYKLTTADANHAGIYKEYIAEKLSLRVKRIGTLYNSTSLKVSNSQADDIINISPNIGINNLCSKLNSLEITPSQVLQAFVLRRLPSLLDNGTNCVTEIMPDVSRMADLLTDNSPQAYGSLYGIPMALSDNFDYTGMDSTIGLAKNLFKAAGEPGVLVRMLQRRGALAFVKTNVPQMLFTLGCDNPIYGISKNSLNNKLTPGLGAACVIKSGSALIALASDIHGSLRISAHNQGIVALKPTTKRFSSVGTRDWTTQGLTLSGVPGLLAGNAVLLSSAVKVLFQDGEQNALDPMALPLPWQEEEFFSSRLLKIGYFTSLSAYPAMEDVQMAVMKAVDLFTQRGHQVVPFPMPDDVEATKIILNIIFYDGGKSLKNILRHEQISASLKPFIKLLDTFSRKNREANNSSAKANVREESDLVLKTIIDAIANPKTADDVLNMEIRRKQFVRDLHNAVIKSGVDLIICPVLPYPAMEISNSSIPGGNVYTSIWNLVHYPAGVVKVGMFSSLSGDENQQAREMPIGVQIVGRPFMDEVVLRGLLEVEKALAEEKSLSDAILPRPILMKNNSQEVTGSSKSGEIKNFSKNLKHILKVLRLIKGLPKNVIDFLKDRILTGKLTIENLGKIVTLLKNILSENPDSFESILDIDNLGLKQGDLMNLIQLLSEGNGEKLSLNPKRVELKNVCLQKEVIPNEILRKFCSLFSVLNGKRLPE